MKKSVEPAWLPHRHSWLKALMLALLMTAITDLIRSSGIWGYFQTRFADSPEPLVVGGILALLFPIPAIAFTHHLFAVFLSRFNQKNQASERSSLRRRSLPSLMSWWEGLYGWLVLILSTLITAGTCTLLLPLFNLSYEKIRLGVNRWSEIELLAWLAVIWIGNAAEFYQIEYIFKRRIIAINALRSKATNSALNFVFKPETEAHPLEEDESGVPQMKAEIAHPLEKMLVEREKRRYSQKVAKNLIIPLLIILIASGIYGFAKWSELQEASPFPAVSQTLNPFLPKKSALVTPTFVNSKLPAKLASLGAKSNPVASENPLPVPYAPPVVKQAQATIQEPPPSAQFEPFQQAVYKATSAANLTQLAQSQAEWRAIARQWEDAIALMKAVPPSSPHYQMAQTKAIEYEQNQTYALKAAASRRE